MRRSRADWPLVLAAWCLLLAAITLLSAASSYADVVAVGAIRSTLHGSPPAARAVSVRIAAAPRDVGAIDASIRAALTSAQAVTGGEIAGIVRAGGLVIAAPGGGSGQPAATLVASYQGIARHAVIVAGRWSLAGATPVEATLSEGAAAGLGVAVGQDVRLADSLDPSRTLDLRVVGTWKPDPADAYWLGSPAELAGIETRGPFTVRGPFVVPAGDLARLGTAAVPDVEWRAVPDLDGLRPDQLGPLRDALLRLPAEVATAGPPGTSVQVRDDLAPVLDRLDTSVLVSRTEQLLVAIQFAFLAGYAIVLVAGVLEDRRRPDVALLRARGVRDEDLARMTIAEAAVLAGSATLVAPLGAGFVVALVAGTPIDGPSSVLGPVLTPTALAVTVVAGLVAGTVTALPTLLGLVARDAIRLGVGRQLDRTLPQRLGLDLGLVVLALLGLWQLRTYGAPLSRDIRGSLGIDPILVGAPAIGLLAGAVLAIRLVPRLGELAERVLAHARGAVEALAGRQLARRSLRYSRAALLLVLAFGLGTFTITEAATWRASQAEQAAYQAVSDVRVDGADYPTLPDGSVGSAYRGIAGVTGALPVLRQPLTAGRAVDAATLLGVDATALERIASQPEDLAADLARTLPNASTVALPGAPSSLALTVDTDLVPVPAGGAPSPAPGSPPASQPANERAIQLALVIRDGDGMLHRYPAGANLLLSGAGQGADVALAGQSSGLTIGPSGPLQVIAIEVTFDAADTAPRTGTVRVVGIEARGQTGAPAAVPLTGAAGWTWATTGSNETPAWSPGQGGGLAIDPGSETVPNAVALGASFRWSARRPPSDAIPAVANGAFLDAAGATPGDVVAVTSLGHDLRLRIAARVERFAPLDPATPWLVVDGPTLADAEYAADGTAARPAEWWLRVAPGAEAAVVARLRDPAYSTALVVGREETVRALTADPVALGLIGALALGAVAAAAFAAIGFVVSAGAAARERVDEFALLQALGLSRRQLVSWQSLEQVYLLGLGAGAGVVLGLVLAWLVVPSATLTPEGQPPVPPAALVVPWASLLPIGLLMLVVLVATLAVVTHQLRSAEIGRILRARDQ